MKFEKLFSPINIRGCVIPNRIMSTAAVTRLAAEDGHVTKQITERYQRMAKGGLGAMVVEAAVVLPSRSSFNLRVSDDEFIIELKQFTDDIRSVNPDVKIGIQLIHFLKLSRSGWRQKVEDLKIEDIKAIPEQFASGALRAKQAGFDFVELHMAHFTTLASFLSLVNKRTDQYGGDFEGRVKLPTKVILAVRDRVGDYPVGMRMNGEEFTKAGNTLLQTGRIAARLARMGVDYISVSAGERFEDADPPAPNFPPFAGTGYSGYRMSPRWWNPDGPQVYLAGGIRKTVRAAGYNIPIVAAGKIRMPGTAETILNKQEADIIGMARTLICDPDWPTKSREGRTGDIVKCAACGYCSESDERYEVVNCIQWPKGVINAPSPWLLAPPCSVACPAGINVREYIELCTLGRYEEALEVIEEKIPLPGVVGRVCPRFCEDKCNRGQMDESVAINGIKRFLCDAVAKNSARSEITPPPRSRTQRVAIIGSGPAGLTAGYHLAKTGYAVTIFEAESVAGGMMALAIPEYRLPRQVLEVEIDRVKNMGVEIRLNSPVGENGLSLTDLRREGYHAIFIAVGAHKSFDLDVPNKDAQGSVSGTAWLKGINSGQKVDIGQKVVVIGGGNVAFDAARMALRQGADEVSIAYRRTSEEMPAIKDEIEAALKEGIKIHYLTSPCRIVCSDGRCTALECFATELGESGEDGRRTPIRIEGSEFAIDADLIISAIGESPDLSVLGDEKISLNANKTINVDPHTMATNIEGIFAGGDATTGPTTVIEAMASGMKAANTIDKYLRGEKLEYQTPESVGIAYDDLDIRPFKRRKRRNIPTLPPAKRIKNCKEVELGYSELDAQYEGNRCLQCGMFPKF
ncbi:MAG: FAD-dependent oxidoreductase [Desulfatiglandaceae bacterium]|jgi:NADPH-dependent glutamate synthase beta subunit-like oxidoreductase/2,4-dienoyl-CoA reductase-like NADH-dependent reductase (Old Yellow Enzyme family)